jgi:Co/Zn/Cd efflux system component
MACCDDEVCLTKENTALRNVFITVLIINTVMFLVEFTTGYLSNSSALIGDSLDMLGDAFVYGISLFVLYRGAIAQVKASLVKGGLTLLLGLYVVGDSVYKIINPVLPVAETISLIGFIALLANVVCFVLLLKYRSKDLNVKSSWICSRNDLIANTSVIVAGFLVAYFNSRWPDIIIGLGIAGVVIQSAVSIIKEGLEQLHGSQPLTSPH